MCRMPFKMIRVNNAMNNQFLGNNFFLYSVVVKGVCCKFCIVYMLFSARWFVFILGFLSGAFLGLLLFLLIWVFKSFAGMVIRGVLFMMMYMGSLVFLMMSSNKKMC